MSPEQGGSKDAASEWWVEHYSAENSDEDDDPPASPASPARHQSRMFARRLELLAGRSSPDSERVAGIATGLLGAHQVQEDVEIMQEDIGIQILTESHNVQDSSDEDSVDEIELRPVEASDGYVDSLDNIQETAEVLGISSEDDEPFDVLRRVTRTPDQATPGLSEAPSTSHTGPARQVTGPPSVSRGKRFPWTSREDYGFSSSSSEEEEEQGAGQVTEAVTAVLTPPERVSRSSPLSLPAQEVLEPQPGPSTRSHSVSVPPANFDQRRFLRQLAASPEISSSRTETSRIRMGLARDLLRALTEPTPTTSIQPPDNPPVPSLPNTTIRRILSVNTADLLSREPGQDQPWVPNLYGPVAGLHSTNSEGVRGPRFEPTVSNDTERLRNSAREVQSIDRIDRILQLSRRSRDTNSSPEATCSRVVGAARQTLGLPTQTNTVAPATLESVTTPATLESVTTPATLESVTRRMSRRYDELLGGEEDQGEVAVPAVKRPRLTGVSQETQNQYQADLAEALQRSLVDQNANPQSNPQPGCSHWTPPDPEGEKGDTGPNSRSPSQAETARDPETNDASVGSEDESQDQPPAPREVEAPTGPNYEEMYRALSTSHRKLVTELQGSLECPVCLDTIRSAPVHCCRNGHLICSTCSVRTFICPTCRSPMSLASGQRCVSHTANKLVDLVPHPCTNRDSGCQVELLLANLRAHEAECRYRQVRCPVHQCLSMVPMAHMAEHVSSFPHLIATLAHPPSPTTLQLSRYITAVGLPASFTLRSFDPIRFSYEGSVFYLQTIASPDRRLLYHFVQLEGNRTDCAKFLASITVASFIPTTPHRVSQTVQPTPLDLHCREDLLAIGEALVMTERAVVTVLQHDSTQHRYQFKIEVGMSMAVAPEVSQG